MRLVLQLVLPLGLLPCSHQLPLLLRLPLLLQRV